MYMPTLARFTSRDPLADAEVPVLGGLSPAVQAAIIQQYAYANNSPANFMDPSGLDWLDLVGDYIDGGPYPGGPSLGWTCATVKAKLQQLRDNWNRLGFDVSVELMDRFLGNRPNNRQPPAGACQKLKQSDIMKSEVCGMAPKLTGIIELLPKNRIGLDALDGEFDGLNDIDYAIGSLHGAYTMIEETSEKVGCCVVSRCKVIVTFKENFAFHPGADRSLNSYYDAGSFYQERCLPSKIRWSMACVVKGENATCPPTVYPRF